MSGREHSPQSAHGMLQSSALGSRNTFGQDVVNLIVWQEPDPGPNALHTTFNHYKAVAIRPAGASHLPHDLTLIRVGPSS